MATGEMRICPEQWGDALARTDGRQLIVAGPGTGKTEFLVRRVGELIRTEKCRRDEVVVLCFSRRAAGSLKDRIDTETGATGVPIDVTTFHSLALRITEIVNGGRVPVPLTTPEQVGIVASVLAAENSEDWPITYRGILGSGAFAAQVADFLMRCSERLLSPEDLRARATERADWRGIPDLYSRYLDRLRERDRTDYGVLLADTVDLLRTQAGQELASRYRYVLVDEFQDTTPAQATMAELLAAGNGNLTVAGDPYQAIYSFRGAELRNVETFSSHVDTIRIVLERSFRVPPEVMQAALRVVSSGGLPGASGPVEPAPHSGRVEAYVFDQETAEAEWIAAEVERAVRVERIAPERIAVLVRSKKELLSELSRALHRRDVEHDPPRGRVVDHPAIRLIADLVVVATMGGPLPMTSPVEAAAADRAMRRILLGPLFGLGLGKERDLLRARRRTWAPWSQVVREHLDDSTGLAGLLEDRSWAETVSAAEGFWKVWSSLEGLDALVHDPERADWRQTWAAFAQSMQAQAVRDPTVSLTAYFTLTEDEDFEAQPLLTHEKTAKRVTLTTLHQAKGLEFDLVFIANASEGVFPDLRRSRSMLRPELLSPERTTDPSAQHLFQLQEEMRLAYTAMTRARFRVVWTATDAGVDQGERRPSRFLAAAAGRGLGDLGPPQEVETDPVTMTEAEIMMRRRLLDPEAPAPQRLAAARLLGSTTAWWQPTRFAGVPEPGADRPILAERIRLSPSQAEAYKRCPRQYALERRLRLGVADSPYAHFGSLVHDALERAESEILGTGVAHAHLERAIECLEEVWEEADFGTPELNAAWLGKAVEMITRLYENWPTGDGVPIALEQEVSATIADTDWIGVVDRVERVEGGVRVIDYKTSTNAMTKEEAASSVQLGFYTLAVGTSDEPVVDAQLWYPRVANKSVSTRSLELDRIADLTEEMAEITRSIREEAWPPRPGDHCERCQFKGSCPAWPEGQSAYLP